MTKSEYVELWLAKILLNVIDPVGTFVDSRRAAACIAVRFRRLLLMLSS